LGTGSEGTIHIGCFLQEIVMIRKNDGTDAKYEMETFETHIKEWI